MSDWNRDSVVNKVPHYGLDSPEIESQWGQDFQHPTTQEMGPTQPPLQWILGLFPRGEAAGAWH